MGEREAYLDDPSRHGTFFPNTSFLRRWSVKRMGRLLACTNDFYLRPFEEMEKRGREALTGKCFGSLRRTSDRRLRKFQGSENRGPLAAGVAGIDVFLLYRKPKRPWSCFTMSGHIRVDGMTLILVGLDRTVGESMFQRTIDIGRSSAVG